MARTFPIFLGGQIKEECKGDLALLIYEVNQQRNHSLVLLGSPDFNRLTGLDSFTNPILRGYLGIKQEVADQVIQQFYTDPQVKNFVYLDQLVVNSYFLR